MVEQCEPLPGCLGVTSSVQGEGRTTVAANLGVVWAADPRERVLLVDGDPGERSLSRLLGSASEAGLTDVLFGRVKEPSEESLSELIRPTRVNRLDVLPGGARCADPSTLLGANSMQRLLESLRSGYTRVILDLPPAFTESDAHSMASIAGGILVVVRAGKTNRKNVQRRLSWLEQARRGSVLGCVLNDVEAT